MGKSAPSPPDPYKVADAQSEANIKTAKEQAQLAMNGQETPWGAVQYVTDPSSPSGYRAVQSLTPEQQALQNQSQDLQASYGGLAGDQLGRVSDTMGTPFSMDAGRARALTDINSKLLDPQWAAREDAMKNDLMNRGIREGSEQWQNAIRDFEAQRSNAYDRMFLDAYSTTNNAALTERNIPITDLNSLGVGAFPSQPHSMDFTNTPTPGVAPTDVVGPVMQAYQAQMQSHNAEMGGLFGMGSAALGGWARAGFPGAETALAFLSDRRTKTQIEKIGDDPRGWGVYRFIYTIDKLLGAAKWQLGFMADEVEKVRPDAVIVHQPTGLKMVNYDALAMA